jgi:hypothetical protein
MNTSMRIKLAIVLALAAVLGGCSGPCSKIEPINGPTLAANGVDLSTYVAVGTSLSAGYQSSGLVDRHQVHSFTALFATQIGKTVQINGQGTFTQPTVNGDGVPPLLEIKSYSPLIISSAGRTFGAPTNLAQNFAYHDLGVPGAFMVDLLDSTFYGTNSYFAFIQRGRGTILSQALSLAPSIMSLEYGSNEILLPALLFGVAPDPSTGATYAQLMTIALNTIHTALPGTRVAVFNVPDVTSIPFFTTFPPFTVNVATGAPLPLIGESGPLQLGDLVLLSPTADSLALGTGIPPGGFNYVYPPAGSNGRPLPESLILRASEVADTRTQIDKINTVVDSVSTRPFTTRVDFAGLLADIAANGVQIGTNHYTSEFITGGLFGLDGVHPSDLGYALMANRMIDAVNTRFGSAIPQVNPLQYASPNASSARPAAQARYPAAIEGLHQELERLYSRRH